MTCFASTRLELPCLPGYIWQPTLVLMHETHDSSSPRRSSQMPAPGTKEDAEPGRRPIPRKRTKRTQSTRLLRSMGELRSSTSLLEPWEIHINVQLLLPCLTNRHCVYIPIFFLAFVPCFLLFVFRFSFLSFLNFFPSSRYVYVLRVPSSVQHPSATLSKYVFYSTCSFCLCHLYPTPSRNYLIFLFV